MKSVEKTVLPIDEYSSVTNIETDTGIHGKRSIRTYRVKVKVTSPQEEMTEFIKFTKSIAELRQQNKLTVDREDPTTFPSFIIQFPKQDIDGSYVIIKNYTIVI